jgi:hypothetical protein
MGFLRVGILLIVDLVVTETTTNEFAAARGKEFGLAFVMGAAIVGSCHHTLDVKSAKV